MDGERRPSGRVQRRTALRQKEKTRRSGKAWFHIRKCIKKRVVTVTTTASIFLQEEKNGGKKGVLFTDHLKKARPPIFYCAPVLSRKDNVLLIRKDIADS